MRPTVLVLMFVASLGGGPLGAARQGGGAVGNSKETAVVARLARCELAVAGLSCGACARAVQGVLFKDPAVKSAVVDWKKGKATVSFEASGTSPERLAKAVKAAGYDASVVHPAASAGHVDPKGQPEKTGGKP